MEKIRTPLKAVREHCLGCAQTAKAIGWCTCDGIHSAWCPLWPYRFGVRPRSAIRKHGEHMMKPELMPDSNMNLDNLPANFKAWKPSSPGQSLEGRADSSGSAPQRCASTGGERENNRTINSNPEEEGQNDDCRKST